MTFLFAAIVVYVRLKITANKKKEEKEKINRPRGELKDSKFPTEIYTYDLKKIHAAPMGRQPNNHIPS